MKFEFIKLIIKRIDIGGLTQGTAMAGFFFYCATFLLSNQSPEMGVRAAKAGLWIFAICWVVGFIWLFIEHVICYRENKQLSEMLVKEQSERDYCIWANDDINLISDEELGEFKKQVTARNISKRAGRKVNENEY